MGKRNTGWNPSVAKRRLNEGRGKGDGVNYKPWLTIHDVASKGCCVRVLGRTVPRIFQLLSYLEMCFFYQLDHDPAVSDIKEQYPLDINVTLDIASKAGIEHPKMNGYPVVMTTDFLYCENNVWHAVAVKPSAELSNKRVREKLELERQYWERRNIEWKIVTEKEVNMTLTRNLIWLWTGEKLENLITSAPLLNTLREVFLRLYDDRNVPFSSIIEGLENECHLRAGTAMLIYKDLIRAGRIQIDLTRMLNTADPRRVLSVS